MEQTPPHPRLPVEAITPLLYSVKDAGRMLGIGHTTTWALIRQGALDTRRIGSRTLVTAASLKHLAENGVTKVHGYAR